jgi:hypothetical protein
MSWFVDKIKKKKNNKTFLISFSANNLVGFGSEWTLKLSVRCKFHIKVTVFYPAGGRDTEPLGLGTFLLPKRTSISR